MYYNELDKIELMSMDISAVKDCTTNVFISDRNKTYELYHLDKKPSFEEFRNKRAAVYCLQSTAPMEDGGYLMVDVYIKASIKNDEYVATDKIVSVHVF